MREKVGTETGGADEHWTRLDFIKINCCKIKIKKYCIGIE